MCGICGFQSKNPGRQAKVVVEAMLQKLARRGPDGSGIHEDQRSGLVMGHQRLAIIDTSAAAAQPMRSVSGRYLLSFNGEIYNYRKLSLELRAAGIDCSQTSDTAVLLSAIEHWGLENSLKKVEGMYAFALLDLSNSRLTLVRDRFGIKPLYYGLVNGDFFFASTLNVIDQSFSPPPPLSLPGMQAYFETGFIPGKLSIYENVFKLEKANLIEFDLSRAVTTADLEGQLIYWSLPAVKNENATLLTSLAAVEELLSEVVADHLVADVPVGVLFSGGCRRQGPHRRRP